MWFPARRSCLILLLFGLLASCADQSLSRVVQFNSDPAGRTEDQGLIVVGLRVAREPVRHSWLLGDLAQHPAYNVSFINIREDGKRGRPTRQLTICEEMRGLANGALSDCTPGRVQYKVISVPPGRYALGEIRYQSGRTSNQTWFAKEERPPGSSRTSAPAYGDRVANPERSFTVRPGEIAYIGNLNFDFEPRSSAADLAVSRDDLAARMALATYPNVRGDLVFKSIVGRSVAAGASFD